MCRPLRECFARVLDCRPKSHSVKGGKVSERQFYFSAEDEEVCFDFYKSPITL